MRRRSSRVARSAFEVDPVKADLDVGTEHPVIER